MPAVFRVLLGFLGGVLVSGARTLEEHLASGRSGPFAPMEIRDFIGQCIVYGLIGMVLGNFVLKSVGGKKQGGTGEGGGKAGEFPEIDPSGLEE